MYLEYDIVVAHPMYAELLHKMANDPNEQGLNLAFESTLVASSGTIGAAAASPNASLTTSSIIVSRATQNLLRTYAMFQPSALLTSTNYPAQSCFGHIGAYSYQVRVGSQYFPAQPAQTDAGMFTCSMTAYGSADRNTSSTVINRVNWSTYSISGAGTGVVLATNEPILAGGATTTYGANKVLFSDSFLPAYGFRVVKGKSDPLDVDGISLSGASGSQLVFDITAAPANAGGTITPFVALVALRFLSAHAGSVRIIGA